MSVKYVMRDAQTALSSAERGHDEPKMPADQRSQADTQIHPSHPVFQSVWFAVNVLLIFSCLLAIYSIGWELSTRRYLKGFSDAIVPVAGSPEERVEAILNWMSHGPTRQPWGPDPLALSRNPTDTLNYDALMRVCGTATNAFINLADSGGLATRRLLLLNSRQEANHVVAEVLVEGRWIIVDPAFRVVLRGTDGKALTRDELIDPTTFAAATSKIAHYSPEYTFDRTTHVRMARFSFVGLMLQGALDRVLPRWENSMTATLLLERVSFATTITAICLLLFAISLRASVRWYGERFLGVKRSRIRHQFLRATESFFNTPR